MARRSIRRDKAIGFAQARRSWLSLLYLVNRGYSYTILRRGRPVARLQRSPG